MHPLRRHSAAPAVLVFGCAIVALALAAVARATVVEGYPYARACPGAGIAEAVDRWHMYESNCTSYVA